MNPEEGSKIDRRALVQRHNPIRTASNITSPMQVGNGRFAFGVDITGLQTFVPFATMSDWGWKNDKLPLGKTPADYQGVSWDTHGRSVRYDMPSEDKELSQWMISNPNRVNLVRIGLRFGDSNIREGDLVNRRQVLDLWTSTIHSSFELGGSKASVETIVHPDEDTIGIKIDSPLILKGN